ncbi:MAG: glycoside hydrolase family 16 protein [Clostridia bacterium]|nr:glycoside hydrolase family 16 protein [Clostridia bacterium]
MSDYRLVWSDEFDVDGKPNPENWGYQIGGHGWGNQESQYYTDRLDNSFVKDGLLHIVAKVEDYEGARYTSGRLLSKGLREFKYGRIEVRAKLPGGKGSWPAIWMLSADRDNVPWPLCGEIDIMEHVGKDQDEIHYSLHTKLYNHKINTQLTLHEQIKGVSEDFHTYAIQWDDGYIEFFVDGVSRVKWERGQDGRDTSPEGWPFDKPFYILLNVAVGGFFGGEIDDSTLPYEMLVDYVRVYQK